MQQPLDCFRFVGTQHPFYPEVSPFKRLLLAHPRYEEIWNRSCIAEVRSYVHARMVRSQGWALKRLELSLQSYTSTTRSPFRSLTLSYVSRADRIEIDEYPNDPKLPAMAPFFNDTDAGVRAEVLRYVPRRRLVFGTSARGSPVIGKFVRPSAVERTYEHLSQVSRTVTLSRPDFSVAAPAGIETDKGLFFQEKRPGRNLSSLINEKTSPGLLHSLGALHCRVHALQVEGIPDWDMEAFFAKVKENIDWISSFLPEHTRFLSHLLDLLIEKVPDVDPSQYAFCHGDFSCLQVLKEQDDWTIVDFDGCVRGDRYFEIAKLIAFLKNDISMFYPQAALPGRDQLSEAIDFYLDGYEQQAGRLLDIPLLRWYRICFEIHYLARLFKRDLYDATASDYTIMLLEQLSEGLRKHGRVISMAGLAT